MILKLLYIIYSKSAKITLSVYVAVGKFVCDINGESLPVLSLCMFKTLSGYLIVPGSFLNGAMFLASGSRKGSLTGCTGCWVYENQLT